MVRYYLLSLHRHRLSRRMMPMALRKHVPTLTESLLWTPGKQACWSRWDAHAYPILIYINYLKYSVRSNGTLLALKWVPTKIPTWHKQIVFAVVNSIARSNWHLLLMQLCSFVPYADFVDAVHDSVRWSKQWGGSRSMIWLTSKYWEVLYISD